LVGIDEETPVPSLDLKAIPLFAGIPDAHLALLVAEFRRDRLAAGETLFGEGSMGDRFFLLVEGEMEARFGDERIAIRPLAPVGELGSLAGLRRATTAVATAPSEVLSLGRDELLAFFRAHGEIGFRFQENLSRILADKLERDRGRIEQMRANLVETQKAMKRMRDALLEAEDTPLHRTLFEVLDAHIEHNRRGRYFIEVPRAVPLELHVDGRYPVLGISNEQLLIAAAPEQPLLSAGDAITGVLVAPDIQIPLSGTVEPGPTGQLEIALDILIDDSATELERLLARLQLLDVIL
jgi:CRP-like cAMP-binding protein